MAGLTITLPREPVLFSIKTVITQGGTTQPPSECVLCVYVKGREKVGFLDELCGKDNDLTCNLMLKKDYKSVLVFPAMLLHHVT